MPFRFRLSAFICASTLAIPWSFASGAVVISPQTTVLIGPGEPMALQKAADDLVTDLGKVFGTPVALVHSASDAGPTTICISLRENLAAGVKRATGNEVLQMLGVANPWKGSPVRSAVILTGSDLRGAIYAVYEFSGKFLGVDPLYYWTDRAPERKTTVAVPDGLALQDGPPTFRYRGWFTNDEDLLTGWKPGTADGTGISLEVWDKVFEALLRLKGNMIVPGTFIFPDEPQVKAAGERGLIISQHHIEVLGTNTYRWPDDKPYSFSAHPDLLVSAWTQAVKEYAPNQEVIWTLGYRGRHDRPFWADDASAGSTDAERAATIQRAIAKQTEIVSGLQKNPFFLMNAWMEAVPFLSSGLLKIPAGVTQVWPDNGHGVIRDDGRIRAGDGVYYHTAMYNSMANQLTEMVPLERIQRELGRAAKAHATEYLLVNTSDIRPVPMTTRAVMELAWNAKPWVDNAGQAATYLADWCRQEFGTAAAPLLAQYYRAYFAAPGRYGTGETQTLADNAYHTVSREILLRLISGEKAAPVRSAAGAKDLIEYAAIYSRAAQEAEPRWQKARETANDAAKLVLPGSRDLYAAHVKTQLDIQQYSNHMLLEIARLASENSVDRKLARLDSAIADTKAVHRALDAAEFGKWAGFYRFIVMNYLSA
jgi:Glycosyl hydrolase family 115